MEVEGNLTTEEEATLGGKQKPKNVSSFSEAEEAKIHSPLELSEGTSPDAMISVSSISQKFSSSDCRLLEG